MFCELVYFLLFFISMLYLIMLKLMKSISVFFLFSFCQLWPLKNLNASISFVLLHLFAAFQLFVILSLSSFCSFLFSSHYHFSLSFHLSGNPRSFVSLFWVSFRPTVCLSHSIISYVSPHYLSEPSIAILSFINAFENLLCEFTIVHPHNVTETAHSPLFNCVHHPFTIFILLSILLSEAKFNFLFSVFFFPFLTISSSFPSLTENIQNFCGFFKNILHVHINILFFNNLPLVFFLLIGDFFVSERSQSDVYSSKGRCDSENRRASYILPASHM